MMWGYVSTGMGWWMVVSSLIWLILIAAAVWTLARWVAHQTHAGASGRPNGSADGASATEILRRRYARGEIDDDTFERVRRQLEGSNLPERTGEPHGIGR
jgi:putative membrane protein